MRLHSIKFLVLSAMLLSTALVAPAAWATLLFSDDFDTGADPAWGNQRGNWRAQDGIYDAANPTNNPITYTDITTLADLTDFVVEVDVNDLDDGGIWLRSRYNGGNINGVLLVTGGSGGNYDGLYWHMVTNGDFSPLIGTVNIAGLQGSDVHLRIEVIGNTYSAFVNGSSTAATTLTTALYGSGSVGLYDFSPTSGATDPRGQTFDNLRVSDFTTTSSIPEPATLALLGLGLAGMGMGRRFSP